MVEPPEQKKRGESIPASNKLSDAPSAASDPPPDEVVDSLDVLRTLVALDELSVVMQPIVRLSTGKVFANEALVRCSVEEYKNPLVLFQKAFELGCTGRLGRMIREIAVPLGAGMPLFVNVHPSELRQSWLVRPDDPIFAHDDEVFIEVTESVPMSHFDLCMSVCRELGSRASVHLVVDDLGAGYSNLMRIADLEPRIVKLDRQLIAGLHRRPRQRKLVDAVVHLCDQLGAEVVAEGVETIDELKALCEGGAQYAQGYLLARPAYPIPVVNWPMGAAAQPSLLPPTLPSKRG